LVALKKAKDKKMTQRQAAEELEISERQVRRLLVKLRKGGDKAILHGLRGRSNRKIRDQDKQQAIGILSGELYKGFGPTLASEYLAKKHKLEVSKETVRKWMKESGLWRSRKQRLAEVHMWRARRERFGELVQWDTSTHDWVEGRGEKIYLIKMIDDATSRLFARFVASDSTQQNMAVLQEYLLRFGRPLEFYTDKASIFVTTPKKNHAERAEPLPPTQIGRALQELGLGWIAAHSPQANSKIFQIVREDVRPRMRKAPVRVETRRDGRVAVRFEGQYLRIEERQPAAKTATKVAAPAAGKKAPKPGRKSQWMSGFWDRPAPSMNKAIRISNATS
jgi:transposase